MSSKITKLLMGAAVMALAPATSAFAAGTAAGTSVTNTFSLSYTVGNQTTTNNNAGTATFVVDRKIDLTTATTTPTVSGQASGTAEAMVFTVTNTSNTPVAFDLDIFQGTGSEDDFDTSNFVITIDVGDGNGPVSYAPDPNGIVVTPNIAPDAVVTVSVTSNLPAGATNGQTGDIALVATALNPIIPANGTRVGHTQAEDGKAITATPAGNNNGQGTVETVLADAASTTQVATGNTTANTGRHSASSTVVVSQANLLGNKQVRQYPATATNTCAGSDFTYPATGSTNDFMTPGNCVIYRIEVTNDGTADASGVSIEDILPANLEFQAASTTLTNGTIVFPGSTTGTGTGAADAANTADCDGTVNATAKDKSKCYVAVSGGALPKKPATGASVAYLYIKALID